MMDLLTFGGFYQYLFVLGLILIFMGFVQMLEIESRMIRQLGLGLALYIWTITGLHYFGFFSIEMWHIGRVCFSIVAIGGLIYVLISTLMEGFMAVLKAIMMIATGFSLLLVPLISIIPFGICMIPIFGIIFAILLVFAGKGLFEGFAELAGCRDSFTYPDFKMPSPEKAVGAKLIDPEGPKLGNTSSDGPGSMAHLAELLSINGIGFKRAKDLYSSGYPTMSSLRNATVEEIAEIDGISRSTASMIKTETEFAYMRTQSEVLRSIRGIGEARSIALYEAGYMTIGSLRNASIEELAEVKGVTRFMAERIKTEVDLRIENRKAVMEALSGIKGLDITTKNRLIDSGYDTAERIVDAAYADLIVDVGIDAGMIIKIKERFQKKDQRIK